MANSNLTKAKNAKNDEFYTQYPDIQKEIEAYLEYDKDTFKDKVVYCNCDDPFESNFFRYFTLNFKRLGLKQLITTSYMPSPIDETQLVLTGIIEPDEKPTKGRKKTEAKRFIINDVGDYDGDGAFTNSDIADQLKANKNNEWKALKGDNDYPAGDFRSQECVELLRQSDIVVTNPPFSLYKEFVAQLVAHNKKFIIIGNLGSIGYKEIFPLVRVNKMWMGNGFNAGNAYFATPKAREFAAGVYDKATGLVKFRNVSWFTNVDHGKRHQKMSLMSMSDNLKYNKKIQKNGNSYKQYENYNAIEVPYTDSIPSDYDDVMGVPASFLNKYNPEQFEVLGICENEDLYGLKTRKYTSAECKAAYYNKFGKKGVYDLNASGVIKNNNVLVKVYQRILIRNRRAAV